MRPFALLVSAFFVSLLAPQVQAAPVGSFQVMDGLEWDFDQPTYSCLDACALLFGGSTGDYSCSTSANAVDHMAFVDGFADAQACTTPVAEDFKLGAAYNCGEDGVAGCSYSAYVADHSCHQVNYCWASGVTPPAATCGNGVLEEGEQCDDGNTVAGDCCSDSCQLEPDGSSCGEGDVCSGGPVCSAGACVAGEPLDCDDGNACTHDSCEPGVGCMNEAAPAPVCEEAGLAWLSIDQRRGTETFSWTSLRSPAPDLGHPDVDTGYALCVYDGSGAPVQGLGVDGGALCDGRPCWKVLANRCLSGVLYRDAAATQDGVDWLSVMSNQHGMTHAGMHARGDAVRAADMGAGMASPVRVQLVNDAGACFQATFEQQEQLVNDGDRFYARQKPVKQRDQHERPHGGDSHSGPHDDRHERSH